MAKQIRKINPLGRGFYLGNKPMPYSFDVDGRMNPLVSIFPENPYYGYFLIGALNGIPTYGISHSTSRVSDVRNTFAINGTDPVIDPTGAVNSTRRLDFRGGKLFRDNNSWLLSAPVNSMGSPQYDVPINGCTVTIDQIEYYRTYLGEFADYAPPCQGTHGFDRNKIKLGLEYRKTISRLGIGTDRIKMQLSKVYSADTILTSKHFEAHNTSRLHQRKSELYGSTYIESWNMVTTGYMIQTEYVKEYPVKKIVLDGYSLGADYSPTSGTGWIPDCYMAGKLIEKERSNLFSLGDLVCAYEYSHAVLNEFTVINSEQTAMVKGFCIKPHRYFYKTARTFTAGIKFTEGDIVRDIVGGGAWRCIKPDIDLYYFGIPANKAEYWTQIWESADGEDYAPYGDEWDDYFSTTTLADVANYVMLRLPD